MKTLIICDSFKGTLSSKQIGIIVKDELAKLNIDSDYIPVSDGGEGFIEAIEDIINIKPLTMSSFGALKDEGESRYIFDEENMTAYIEMAEVCGIIKLDHKRDAYKASSYGLGDFTKKIIEKHHPKKVVISLGGSASVDLGIGFLEGLGVKFYDEDKNLIDFIGNEKLPLIKHIDDKDIQKYKDIEFVIVNDISTTIFGPDGAIEKYGKQKCSLNQDVSTLKNNILAFFPILKEYTTVDDHVGTGAAGGIGYAIEVFLNGYFISGTELIFNLIKLNEIADSYDFLITGEGHFDSQTFQGKVVSGVLKASNRVIIICGGKDEEVDNKNVYSIVPDLCSLEESMKNPEKYLRKLIANIDFKNLNF